MLLIGLNGRMHSGKDTAVEYIREEANALFYAAERRTPVVQRAGFADKLKLSAARALGFDPDSVEEAVDLCNQIKEKGYVETWLSPGVGCKQISGREFLQRYGTESHRDVFGDNFWVDALLPARPWTLGGAPVLNLAPGGEWGEPQQRIKPVNDLFPGVDVLVVTDVRFENEASRILQLGGGVWYIEADGRLGPLPEGAHASERPLPQELITRTVRNNDTLDDFKAAMSAATVEALS